MISWEKVSKLRSIAELNAFYGIGTTCIYSIAVGLYRKYIERSQLVSFGQTPLSTQPEGGNNPTLSLSLSSLCVEVRLRQLAGERGGRSKRGHLPVYYL